MNRTLTTLLAALLVAGASGAAFAQAASGPAAAAKREAVARNLTLHFTGHSPAVFDALELCKLSGLLGDPVLIHSPS